MISNLTSVILQNSVLSNHLSIYLDAISELRKSLKSQVARSYFSAQEGCDAITDVPRIICLNLYLISTSVPPFLLPRSVPASIYFLSSLPALLIISIPFFLMLCIFPFCFLFLPWLLHSFWLLCSSSPAAVNRQQPFELLVDSTYFIPTTDKSISSKVVRLTISERW